ncbi:RNA polymerase II subunit A C-terminal domain phosphatase SSU72-like [Bolinopsis microptera]|uniref:RNA polymerase II subunit A C-terminal domain phosphatase SSU72-like n=1 Tax=Bolinopsis microptera TaxID=2820187 RepID=UPI00307AA132
MRHDLSIAVVCSSNQNRSMEAHHLLSKKGFRTKSYGTGSKVKLPGPTVDKPNVYDFNTPYEQIAEDLRNKDMSFYTQNGLLNMLDRNKRIKGKPEKFQRCNEEFDLIVTCQERVFDQVLEYMNDREQVSMNLVHVVNVEIRDNHEEATLGSFIIYDLVEKLSNTEDPASDIDTVIDFLEKKRNKRFLHSVAFY